MKEKNLKTLLLKIEKSNFSLNLKLDRSSTNYGYPNMEILDREHEIVGEAIFSFFQDSIVLTTLISENFKIIDFLNDKFNQIELITFHLKKIPDIELKISEQKRLAESFRIKTEAGSFSTIFVYKDILFYANELGTLKALYVNVSSFLKNFKKRQSTLSQYFDSSNVGKFFMVKKSGSTFMLQDCNIENYEIDIYSNYNDDLIEADQVIKEAFLKSHKGIVILDGIKGTGKTHYIRHLINFVNKKFIIIPSYLANSLTEPGFITFIMDKCKNSVLILEDMEKILVSRENSESVNVISDILNMSDGLLSDALKVQFIFSFNTKFDRIDDALTRPGRLIQRYYFGELTDDKAKKLFKKLNKEETSQRILGNILNNVTTELEKKKTIGFKS